VKKANIKYTVSVRKYVKTYLIILLISVATALTGCGNNEKQIIGMSVAESLIVMDNDNTKLPEITVTCDDGTKKVLSYTDFWFNGEYTYVQDGKIKVKGTAPTEFDDELLIKYKNDDTVTAVIKIQKIFVAIESIQLNTAKGETVCVPDIELQLLVNYFPDNSSQKNVEFSVLTDNASVDKNGMLVPFADCEAGDTVTIVATTPNDRTATINLTVMGRVAVATPLQLSAIRQNPDAHYFLTNDIELSGEWDTVPQLNGSFNGYGHCIGNLKITVPATRYDSERFFGLFGKVDGVIKNLKLNNAVITSADAQHNGAWTHIGTIAGQLSNNGIVTGAEVKNSSLRTARQSCSTGGLVGIAVGGRVQNSSFNNGDIFANGDTGAIIGGGNNANITGCSVDTAELKVYTAYTNHGIGGIAGATLNNTILSSCNVYKIQVIFDDKGGIDGDKLNPFMGFIVGYCVDSSIISVGKSLSNYNIDGLKNDYKSGGVLGLGGQTHNQQKYCFNGLWGEYGFIDG
jgi:hypothetical protein